MTIFLDTGPLYALLEPRDQGHSFALALFQQAKDETLMTPLPAALELHSLMVKRKPSDPSAAHRTVQSVLEVYPLVYPTADDTDSALKLLAKFSDQRITLADTLIATLAVRHSAEVMTFDGRHFSLMAARVYGS